MLNIVLQCKGVSEMKMVNLLEKYGRSIRINYSVDGSDNNLQVSFNVRTISARNEILRRIKLLKKIELLTVQTHRGDDDGKLC